jgi:phosphoadenosine phosphosulfate reductase
MLIEPRGENVSTIAGQPETALLAEIEQANARFETSDATEVVAWALEHFGDDIILASSFQDAVLIDLAVKVAPQMKVVFLDTGFHFPETLAYMRRLRDVYNLNLDVVESGLDDATSPCGSPNCCELRKVVPLNRALEGKAGWITGLKRVDTPERANAPIVSWDEGRRIVKINPMATWTDDDVDDYVAKHNLARHPLNYVGYISIGCAPTTRPVAPGEDPRAGRWPDSDKTECGLHI